MPLRPPMGASAGSMHFAVQTRGSSPLQWCSLILVCPTSTVVLWQPPSNRSGRKLRSFYRRVGAIGCSLRTIRRRMWTGYSLSRRSWRACEARSPN